jgi:hypothetical protein
MKICPTCRKTYADDGLNFCLEDGSVLTFAAPSQEATVVMNPPRPTDPSPGTARPTTGPPPGWGNQPVYLVQPPKKSSKTWLWVLGILGLAVLLCGGGGVGLILLKTMSDANTVSKGNSVNRPNAVATPAAPPFSSTSVDTIDLSQWVKDFSLYGTTEFVDDELVMASKKKNFYYVLVAPDTYKTDGAATRVTVRNVGNANSSLGYGLIFHSDPAPLIRDYAFLIDSKKQKYRVVRHEPSKEDTVVSWTNSALINEGSQANILEARDKGDTVDLYINGQLATSIKNTLTPKGGVPGLYSGDAVKIGFKKMEIAK